MSDEQLRQLERAYIRSGLDYRVIPSSLLKDLVEIVERCCDCNHGNPKAHIVRKQLKKFLEENNG